MKIYIAEARGGEWEDAWSHVIFIGFDESVVKIEAAEYKKIRVQNKKLATEDFDILEKEWDEKDEDTFNENLYSNLTKSQCEMDDDFYDVVVYSYEIDKPLYNKEDLKYVPVRNRT